MAFTPEGYCLASEQRELRQHYPRSGWVEHDPEEIWQASLACARAVVERVGGADRVAAIGIANQRETILFWHRRTGQALGKAIVWQDRRTAALCERLKEEGHEPDLKERTGLLLDPYFSASKIAWAMDHWPQLREAGADLMIGTVESWLIYRLSAGLHVTDASNAARTGLMDIRTGLWDSALLDLFDVPPSALPEIVDCAGVMAETDLFGRPIPITGMAGDQQAAAIGQACFEPGDTKATYGTGAFILANTGEHVHASGNRLLATVGWRIGGRTCYALEGSIFVAGSLIQWLRDGLGLIEKSRETQALAASVPDNGGVYLVPALSGLGAPHWRPEARAAISGLSFASNRAHIVRAAVEAMAHQTHDLMEAFGADGVAWERLKIDGGMAENDWMAQDLADMLDLEVERPALAETTALGAAMLAGVGCGLFASLEQAAQMRGEVRHFRPSADRARVEQRLQGWRAALAAVLATPSNLPNS